MLFRSLELEYMLLTERYNTLNYTCTYPPARTEQYIISSSNTVSYTHASLMSVWVSWMQHKTLEVAVNTEQNMLMPILNVSGPFP